MVKNVLLVSIGFSPNVGGIESHFDDLIKVLLKRGYKATVLTYQPLTSMISAPFIERHKNLIIYRLRWFRGKFYQLVNYPAIEFGYLVLPLFIGLGMLLILQNRTKCVIHSHGIIAGFVAVFWGKIFRKRVIVTTHSIYNFPSKGFYRSFAKWVFCHADHVLTLSKQSAKEIIDLGVPIHRVSTFTYWIDLRKFEEIKRTSKNKAKTTFLFVGRLVPEKGILVLLDSVKHWPSNSELIIIGIGPLEKEINERVRLLSNVKYIGKITQEELPKYYSSADALIVPSVHEEGFGRVILESLACGTPVIGSNRGAIPEAMDESVGMLIDVSPKNITKAVEYFCKNSGKINELSKAAKIYARKRYSQLNANQIIKYYE